MSDSRIEYVHLMKNIFAGGISFSEAKNTVSEQNRSFFNMLFMTAFRQLTFIKTEVLPQFVKKKIPHKQQILEFILYLSITELLFLDTPDYAVINSYVEVAKKTTDKFGANFINAVLRNILRNKEQLLAQRKTKFFSTDFVKILKQDYTSDEISEMENMVTIEPPLDLTFKIGVTPKIDNAVILPTGSVRLPADTKIIELDAFKQGLCWAQDATSALPVKCLFELKGKKVLDICAAPGGKKVLDICAAPGGKTAQLLDAGAIVTAVDISEKRLDLLKQNIDRLGLANNLKIICADALNFSATEKFDVILLDAPCSATGTFRRHRERHHNRHHAVLLQLENVYCAFLGGACSSIAHCAIQENSGPLV